MIRRKSFWGMACHSWTRASVRDCTLSGGCCRCPIRLESMSQACSIGLRSGDLAGQFITLIPSSSRKVVDTRAVWARALSCINMNVSPIAPAYGLPIGSRTSSRYLTAVIPPLGNTYKSVRPSNDIPAQTITEPPPYRSTSTMLQLA